MLAALMEKFINNSEPMIGDQNQRAVESENHDDVPAIPRIPPMIALSAKIFNERITVKFTKNNYEIKKPEYASVTTIKNDNRLAVSPESTNSDTENNPTENSHPSEEMPPRSKSPSFSRYENNSSTEGSESSSSKEVFECEFCPKTYSKKKKYLKHKNRRHVARQMFNCKYCEMIFQSRSSWDYHVKSKHLQQREFVCEECDKWFVRKDHLAAHIKSHKYPCHFCGKLFTAKYKLNRHKEIHRVLQCDQCPMAFFREHRLQRHKNLKHPNTQVQNMREESHQEESHQPEEPTCQEESSQPEESMSQVEEPMCPVEESMPQVEEPMSQDEQSCSEEESSHEEEPPPPPGPQRCQHCGRTFPSLEDLHHHWRVTGDNLIICVHCFEICDNELSFRLHLLKHSEEKIFMCTACSKTFVTMDLLENHFSTHSSQSN